MTATVGSRRTAATTRAVSAGAPQTSITARLELGGQVVGQHGGDGAAEQDGVAVAGHLLAAAVPAREAVLDDQRGQGERDQGGDPVARPSGRAGTPARPPRRCRRACRRSRSRGSASCRGRRRSRAPRRGPRRPSPSCLRSSWRNDAASRLSRSTRIRTSSGHSSRRVSSRCGGLRQHRRLVQHPVQAGRIAGHGHAWPIVLRHCHLRQEIFRRGIGHAGRSSYSDRGAAPQTDAPTVLTPASAARAAMSIETAIGLETGQPYPYRAGRAGRARLDPLPGLEGRHRRGVGVGAVAARALRQERQAAARAARRPASTSGSTPTSSATRPSGPPCRCWCRRR